MREIKFRAWIEESKTMETGLFGLRSDGKPSFNKDAILLQFTGLTDKNGKEIYEGDIVNFCEKKSCCKTKTCETDILPSNEFCSGCGRKIEEVDFITKAKVVFYKSGFAYEYNESEESSQIWRISSSEIYLEWVEVIGNIYEL